MWRDLRPRTLLAATWRLLVLEMRLLTGGRAWLVFGGQALWLAIVAILHHRSSDPDDPVAFYNSTIVLPSLLTVIGLGVSAVLREQEIRHLEMSFASPGGRFQLWAFRLGALGLLGAVSCAWLSVGTWIAITPEVTPWVAAPHALVPVLLAASVAVFLSLLFNRIASAGLVTAGVMLGGGVFVHGAEWHRGDPYLNPFNPPREALDPGAWTSLLVFNRTFLLTLTGIAVALALGLLQRRERLL